MSATRSRGSAGVRARRRAALCLGASAVLHVATVVVLDRLTTRDTDRVVLRAQRMPIERLRLRPAVPVSSELLRYIRTEAVRELEIETRASEGPRVRPAAAAPGSLDGEADDEEGRRGVVTEASVTRDSFAITDWIPGAPEPETVDAVELDAQRRVRNVVIVNGEDNTLGTAHLHLPTRTGPGGNALAKTIQAIQLGESLPGRTPITVEMHYVDGPLARDRLDRYSVLFWGFADLGSMDAVADYIERGGSFFGGPSPLSRFADSLRARLGDRITYRVLDIDHRLYRSLYQIEAFSAGGPHCQPVGPVPVVLFDDRIVATGPLVYVRMHPCVSNRLYVNALAYLLAQPSQLAGRLVAGGRAAGAQHRRLGTNRY